MMRVKDMAEVLNKQIVLLEIEVRDHQNKKLCASAPLR